MRFRNPSFVDPTAAAAAVLAPKISAYLAANAGREWVGLARLKADVPEAGAASRAVINAALVSLGVVVDSDGADNA